MDIAALSTNLSMAELSMNVGVAVLDNSMEVVEDMGAGMIKMLESSVQPELGQNIDIRI